MIGPQSPTSAQGSDRTLPRPSGARAHARHFALPWINLSAQDELVQRILWGKAAHLHAPEQAVEVAHGRAECRTDDFCLPGLQPVTVHAFRADPARLATPRRPVWLEGAYSPTRPTSSPPAMVARALKTSGLIDSLTKRADPSTNRTMAPPTCVPPNAPARPR